MGQRRRTGLLAAALVLGLTGAALAAAPRDAIRDLPVLTHSSEFTINSNETAGSYQDNYRGTWQIDWLTKEIRLPGAALRADLDYTTTLRDSLDRVNRSSSDIREDGFNFRLDLNTPGGLRGRYMLNQRDGFSNRTPSPNPRTWNSSQTKEMGLNWERPELPRLYATHTVRTNNDFFGERQSSASEVASTNYGLAYQSRSGAPPVSYSASSTLVESENYLPQRSSSSQRQSSVAAMRSLSLGRIGNLTLNYNYDESSVARPGELRATTNSTSSYNLSLLGSVPALPLEYDYNYGRTFTAYQSQPGESQSFSNLRFTYRPKLPPKPGRSAALQLAYRFEDYEAATRNTSRLQQNLNWSYSINPRMSGNIVYGHQQFQDDLLARLANESDNVSASLAYSMPKNRGAFNGGFTQETRREPNSDATSSNIGLNANASFNLDQRSNFSVFLSKQSSDNQQGAFGLPRSTESLSSGFTYRIASGQGLGLTASWRQTLTETQPSQALSTSQQLNVILNYDPPLAGWHYQLSINGSDYSTDNPAGGSDRSYNTSDVIQAIVSYSF